MTTAYTRWIRKWLTSTKWMCKLSTKMTWRYRQTLWDNTRCHRTSLQHLAATLQQPFLHPLQRVRCKQTLYRDTYRHRHTYSETDRQTGGKSKWRKQRHHLSVMTRHFFSRTQPGHPVWDCWVLNYWTLLVKKHTTQQWRTRLCARRDPRVTPRLWD